MIKIPTYKNNRMFKKLTEEFNTESKDNELEM